MKALFFFLTLFVAAFASAQAPSFSHIVVIVQENRTPDNLFGSNPLFEAGVDLATFGLDAQGQQVQLTSVELDNCYDLPHAHLAFVHEYNNGGMNGFSKVQPARKAGCEAGADQAYRFVDNSLGQVQPYFDLATNYAFGNRMFQTNQGPSLPAHQFLVSGTSAPSTDSPLFVADNPNGGAGDAGCLAPKNAWVYTIDSTGKYGKTYPCFDTASILDELQASNLSWAYYSPNSKVLWDAPASLIDYYQSPYNILKPKQVLKDIAACHLANVVWVTPTGQNSDHAGGNAGGGPAWVASIVNAIGTNKACPNGDLYWNDTAILITWDDWGGWYDHVPPPPIPGNGWGQAYIYGFRLPLLVVSAYTPAGYVDNVTHDFGSFLRFTEQNFGLSLIGPGYFADSYADDMSSFFTLTTPRPFVQIKAPKVNFEEQAPMDPDNDDD